MDANNPDTYNTINLRGISATSIFHFTNKSNLLGILKNYFLPRFAVEDVSVKLDAPENLFALPMVSFCDIPLSQINNHANNYGCYALGLTKEWAKGKKIGPVTYISRGSHLADNIADLFDNNFRDYELKGNKKKIRSSINYLPYFIKNYEGRIYRHDVPISDRIFYDEREWRFVPPLSLLNKGDFLPFLTPPQFMNETFRDEENLKVGKFSSLHFTPNDIRFIIVKYESEILSVLKDIMEIKNVYSEDDKLLLTTRLISLERIYADF